MLHPGKTLVVLDSQIQHLDGKVFIILLDLESKGDNMNSYFDLNFATFNNLQTDTSELLNVPS